MKAVEFDAELSNNTIQIPENFQLELSLSKDKNVRVILLINDSETIDEVQFSKTVQNQFLRGYDSGDSIYDHM